MLNEWIKSFTFLVLIVWCNSSAAYTNTIDSVLEDKPCRQAILKARLDSSSLKTIRLLFHVIRKSDQSGSFHADNEQIEKYFLEVVHYINNRLANNEIPKPNSGSAHIPDVKLRVTGRIKFWDHDTLYDMFQINDNPSAEGFYQFLMQDPSMSSLEKHGRLHIIIMPRKVRPILGGSASGICDKRFIQFKGTDWEYNDRLNYGGQNNYDYAVASHGGHILHEMGHNLCLLHNFCCGASGYQEDACLDNNQADGQPPIQQSSNNYLDYTGWNETRSLSACQIGILHRSLANNINGIADLVELDTCINFKKGISKVLSSEEENLSMEENTAFKKLIVKKAVTLVCPLMLAEEAVVKIKKRGIVTFYQSKIEPSCSGVKRKIVVYKGGILMLNQTDLNEVEIMINKGGIIILNNQNRLNNSTLMMKSGSGGWGKGLNPKLEWDTASQVVIKGQIYKNCPLTDSDSNCIDFVNCLKGKK